MRQTAFAVIATLVTAIPLSGQENFYGYHPMGTMALGVGLNPNDLSQVKMPCIFFETVANEAGGAQNTQYEAVLVRDHESLKRTLGIDAKVDASYLAFSGGATFSYNSRQAFDRNALTYVISARTEYGNRRLRNPQLTPAAQQLLAAERHADFRNRCGSLYVVEERRGAAVHVILRITDVDASMVESQSAGVKASGGIGAFSASADIQFKEQLERAASAGRLDIQVVATGGAGFGGLAELVRAASARTDALTAIQSALATYIGQFNLQNAAATGFHLASMEDFDWNPAFSNPWPATRQRRLEALTMRFRAASDTVAEIIAILNHSDSRWTLFQGDQEVKLRQARDVYEAFIDGLQDAHRRCKENPQAGIEICQIPSESSLPGPAIFPELPARPTMTVAVTANGSMIDDARVRQLARDLVSGEEVDELDGLQRLTLRLQGHQLRRVRVLYGNTLLTTFTTPKPDGSFEITAFSRQNLAEESEWHSDIVGLFPLAVVFSSGLVGDTVTLTSAAAWTKSSDGCSGGYVGRSPVALGMVGPPPKPGCVLDGTIGIGAEGWAGTFWRGHSQGAGTPGVSGVQPFLGGGSPVPAPPALGTSGVVRFELQPATLRLEVEDGYARRTSLPLVRLVERRTSIDGIVYVTLQPGEAFSDGPQP